MLIETVKTITRRAAIGGSSVRPEWGYVNIVYVSACGTNLFVVSRGNNTFKRLLPILFTFFFVRSSGHDTISYANRIR